MTGTLMHKNKKHVQQLEQLWHLVGNTPMLEIRYEYKGQLRSIYAKAEHYNLTGSIKDRMALYILQRAYALRLIQPGHRIIEATSGNTGISFAAIGKALGHPVTIIMPDWLSKERIDIIRSLGANVQLISKEQGGFLGSIKLAEQMATEQDAVFLPRQFENSCNAEAHQRTTAIEICKQLESIGKRPDAFVAGVGTGGTIMGMHAGLKKKNPYCGIYPLEPLESPTLSTGYKVGTHRIQGVSDEFIPPILDLSILQDVVQVSDGDAILMAQQLAAETGLAVGISSGANILGAIQVQNLLGDSAKVVTVLPDSNKKYLSTDLVKAEPVLDHFITPHVRLIDYTPIKRIHE